MESTNQVAKNEPHVGGAWGIVDQREGKNYRAIGKYIEVDPLFTFRMPQFSDTEDRITVEIKSLEKGFEMTFTQVIVVPHEEGWTEEDIEEALVEYNGETEQGWGYMFEGLKQLV